MSWENLIKGQGIFSKVIILLILITSSHDNVWISLGENCCWSLLGLKGLNQNWLEISEKVIMFKVRLSRRRSWGFGTSSFPINVGRMRIAWQAKRTSAWDASLKSVTSEFLTCVLIYNRLSRCTLHFARLLLGHWRTLDSRQMAGYLECQESFEILHFTAEQKRRWLASVFLQHRSHCKEL